MSSEDTSLTTPPLHLVVLLIVLVGVTFGRAVTFGFTDWDDNINVYANPYLINPSLKNFLQLWIAPYASLYVPLVYTSYYLETICAQVIGGALEKLGVVGTAGPLANLFAAALMHFDNVVLHAVASVYVMRIITVLGVSSWPAFLGAAVFAAHPLQVEPVAWVTGRKDLLAGALSLVALERFQAMLHTPQTRRHLIVSTVAFLAALFAKPSVVTIPLLACAVGWYHQFSPRKWGRTVAVWFVAAAVIAIVGQGAQADLGDAPFSIGWWKRPFLAADNLRYYAVKFLVPVGLAPISPRTVPSVFASYWWWVSLPVVLAIIWVIRRSRALVLAAAWIALPLLPVLGFAPFIFQYFSAVADRYCYLSLGGVAWLVAVGVNALDNRLVARKLSTARRWIFWALGVWVAILCGISFRQVGFWKSPESLWQRELAINPTCSHALYNLASRYADKGRLGDAIATYQKLLEVDPNYAPAFTNLMLIYRRLGKTQMAKTVARAALALAPGSADNFIARGHAYLELGEARLALESFNAALTILSNDVQSLNGVGMAYLALGDLDNAERSFLHALKLYPQYPAAHANLGLIYAKRGQHEAARSELQTAIQLDPTDMISRRELASLEMHTSGSATNR